nr:hypothetical protein [Chlamydiota bacterium]
AKIMFSRAAINQRKIREGGKVGDAMPPMKIQVDGGIDDKTAKQCIDAGANVLVAGTYLFGAPQMRPRIETLRGLAT